jgi:hypothetical protein
MTRAFGLVGVLSVALVSSASAIPARQHDAAREARVKRIDRLSFEFVGQFVNSPPGVTPATHTHYGYLSYIRGVRAFRAAPAGEATALFTFFADATTLRVIPDGPLRIVTRVGKLTIYRDASGNASFGRPETFADGTRVLVATFRQQVVLDTVTNAFTTFHQATITSTRPFSSGGGRLQLGRRGQTFTIAFSGHGAMPGPPSGYIGGYAVSG